MMNTIANGNGKGAAVRSSSAVGHFPQNQQALQGIQKVAAMVVPVAARLAPIAAQIDRNPAVPLYLPQVPIAALLREGEMAAARMEQKCFGPNAAETEAVPSEVAMEAALTEVLAAEANHAQQESEAAALIGTALSIAIASLQGKRTLRPIVPALVRATARLVRLMRERGPAGRQLLRLVPTILRRTLTSLLAARQAGRAIDAAFTSRVMAAQAARILANSQGMTQAMIRNAMIRQRTVAPARYIANSPVVSSNSRRFSPMTMLNEGLFEAPVSHEANLYSNPYANPEFEDEWETNPELESEWEMQAGSHYSNPYSNPESHYGNPYTNPEFEEEWETNPESHYSNPYANPEFEDEWETNPESHYSNPYANPEFEDEWETNPESHYSNPYANPEFEDEGEYFLGGLKKFAKKAWKVAAPLAKKLAPKLAGTLVGMIPGVGAVAGPLAAKLTGALIKEGQMEAAQLEAAAFGTNAAEAEVANTEVAYEAALTEVLAAQAAEASTEAEAEVAIGSTLPITISIMGGRRALRPVMPVLAQANAKLSGTLRRQGPAGRQLLRTLPTIQRRTVGTLKAAARSGQPITGATAVKAMASATRQVLSNPKTVQRAIVRNAVLRQRTAPPNPRRAAARPCPTCAR
jgi:hypothetical protein